MIDNGWKSEVFIDWSKAPEGTTHVFCSSLADYERNFTDGDTDLEFLWVMVQDGYVYEHDSGFIGCWDWSGSDVGQLSDEAIARYDVLAPSEGVPEIDKIMRRYNSNYSLPSEVLKKDIKWLIELAERLDTKLYNSSVEM